MYYEDNYEIDSDIDISHEERNQGYRGTYNQDFFNRALKQRVPTPGKVLRKSISPLYKL